MKKLSTIPEQPKNAEILASRFGQIFDAASTPVAGSTEEEAADEKMAKDPRSKTGIFRLFGYILILLFATPAFSICLIDCNTTKCSNLNYYMGKCNKCKSVGRKCSASFCGTHPELCHEGRPLRPLSVGTMDIREDRLHDVCMAPLFARFNFEGLNNSALTPDNLNTLNIVFFEQTGGDAKRRNIGSVRNVLASYFSMLYPELRSASPEKAFQQVNLMIQAKFGKTLGQASNLDLHHMIETVRVETYKRKGIPTTKVFERYKNRNYPVTITDMGCKSERMFKPIR